VSVPGHHHRMERLEDRAPGGSPSQRGPAHGGSARLFLRRWDRVDQPRRGSRVTSSLRRPPLHRAMPVPRNDQERGGGPRVASAGAASEAGGGWLAGPAGRRPASSLPGRPTHGGREGAERPAGVRTRAADGEHRCGARPTARTRSWRRRTCRARTTDNLGAGEVTRRTVSRPSLVPGRMDEVRTPAADRSAAASSPAAFHGPR
jgi:hypothetical protein